MARLLSLEAQVRAGHGDWGGAIDSYLDAVRMGVDILRGGNIFCMLAGTAVQATGRKDAYAAVDHLTAAQARATARRLEEITTRQSPYWKALLEEKWSGLGSLMEILREPDWWKELDPIVPTGWERFIRRLQAAMVTRRKIIYTYGTHMDQLIADARMPYAVWPRQRKDTSVPLVEMFVAMVPVDARFFGESGKTYNSLLLLMLALRAYRIEHGQYPMALTELVPSYLKRIPNDPFALKGPLRYKRVGSKCVPYSIGPDGKDDGGKPVDAGPAVGKGRYRVRENTKGDIVAGINY
jgi:hypothetical protein